MFKKILISSLALTILSGCTLKKPSAGIEIKSNPQAQVFINDKSVGKTPYKDEKMTAGEYTLKLKSDRGEWSNKVRIAENTVYYINRDLAQNPEDQSGENVSLEKGKGVTIVTIPAQVEVSLDGQKQGNTPYLIPSISPGQHTIALSKQNYATKSLKVAAVEGYKIVVEAQLKREEGEDETASPSASPSPSASASGSPKASGKASPTPKATATPKASPNESPKASPDASAQPSGNTVTILSTPTGWLRVRDRASLGGAEIGKVNTGETYPYTERLDSGWTKITLQDGTEGYISSKYTKVNK